MPYIDKARRDTMEFPNSAGELNFVITMLCLEYLDQKYHTYDTHNSIIGVLECVKQEWYRRMVVPYEEKKREENGDVFPS